MAWGYVEGGMGCDLVRHRRSGRVTGRGARGGRAGRARSVPGEGVVLEGGELIRAPVVISNADPKATLGLLGGSGSRRPSAAGSTTGG